LEIRVVDTLSAISYHDNSAEKLDEKQRETVQIVKAPSYTKTGKNWLIVDDLVDTGETAKAVRALLPKAHFATVYAKPAGRPLVDTFVTEVSQDTWIYFPWDLEPRPVDPISFNNR
jgi:xanthine phosphoribosyltransferase